MATPKVIFLFSGKRKSGKDFITDKLLSRLTSDQAVIVRLAGPIKKQFAADHSLDFQELLSTADYKERYRRDMINWSDAIRDQQPPFFMEKALEMYKAEQVPVWIVSDMRRRSDLECFRTRYPGLCVTVRVTASEEVRMQRGWHFTAGVDDVASECDLDGGVLTWDHVVDTSAGDEATVLLLLAALEQVCRDRGVDIPSSS